MYVYIYICCEYCFAYITKFSPSIIQTNNNNTKQTTLKGNMKRGSIWPSYLHPWTMKTDDIPDVFIAPNHSVIMEIKCAELVVTDQFSAGKTPRFPRCVNIRYDKGWYESMTQKELLDIKREATIGAEDAGGGQARRLAKRKKNSRQGGVQVVEGMQVVSKEDALQGKSPSSNIFEGFTFTVVPWGEARVIDGVPGLVLPWSKRSRGGGSGGGSGSGSGASQYSSSTYASTLSQNVSQLTQGDLVGLDPEDAAKISEMRNLRKKRLSVSDMQRLLYENGADLVYIYMANITPFFVFIQLFRFPFFFVFSLNIPIPFFHTCNVCKCLCTMYVCLKKKKR